MRSMMLTDNSAMCAVIVLLVAEMVTLLAPLRIELQLAHSRRRGQKRNVSARACNPAISQPTRKHHHVITVSGEWHRLIG
mmetsp:Transcript_67219/g.133214  ORF Transcript_67219/g.133214 Transcript_67219/m.133214 type:complete len:80 (-) Transcript_67219:175-414(-)